MLLDAARDARRVVEIGVYEGASALALCQALAPGAELHLVDPFGAHPDALPSGWGASEWATRRAVARAVRRRGRRRAAQCAGTSRSPATSPRAGRRGRPRVHRRRSLEAGASSTGRAGTPFVAPGGRVVFHDARAGEPGGSRPAGPTPSSTRHFRTRGHARLGDPRRGRPHGRGRSRVLSARSRFTVKLDGQPGRGQTRAAR